MKLPSSGETYMHMGVPLTILALDEERLQVRFIQQAPDYVEYYGKPRRIVNRVHTIALGAWMHHRHNGWLERVKR